MTAKALHNAEAAVAKLVAFLREPVLTDRDRVGVIHAFEFTFEATWKLLKHVAEREGLDAESPKRALIAGHKLGHVRDEGLWLEMLQDRDLTSHVYHSELADRIYPAINTRYAAALTDAVMRVTTALR